MILALRNTTHTVVGQGLETEHELLIGSRKWFRINCDRLCRALGVCLNRWAGHPHPWLPSSCAGPGHSLRWGLAAGDHAKEDKGCRGSYPHVGAELFLEQAVALTQSLSVPGPRNASGRTCLELG